MYRLLALLFFSLTQGGTQMVYYPDDNGNVIYNNKLYPMAPFGSVQAPNRFSDQPSSITQVSRIPPRGSPEYDQFVTNAISTGLMKLTAAVNKVITSKSSNQYNNIVFAPVSMAASLALVLLGANGKTYQEISTLLGFATGVPDLDKKSQIVHDQFGKMILKLERTSGFVIGSQVNFATAIFVQNNFPIRTLYKTTAENVYQSEVLNLDFQQNPVLAQKSINAWVSDRTKGKIKEVLSDVPSANTKVILASAMYFNAQWEHPFFDGATNRRRFYVNGKHQPSDIWVDMMSNGGDFPYYKDKLLDCEIIGFPYKGNHTTMYVVKPNNSSKEKLKLLEDALTVEHMLRLVSNVRITSSVILFPKMLIDTTLDLKTPLKELGISSLFDPNEANLALLSPGPTAFMQNVTGTVINPISPTIPKNPYEGDDSVLIFNRFGDTVNCTDLFDKTNNNITTCEQVVSNTSSKVIYKKIGDKIGRRIVRNKRSTNEDLDSLRASINRPENPANFENPGLFADKVIHKVYMHITETGTEAAASTVFGLSKSGTRNIFRTEVPFFFFIMHEETKVIMFWGSVNRPTPFYASGSTQ